MSFASDSVLGGTGVPERAPSQVSAEEPSLARLLGWVGFLMVGGGLMVLLFNSWLGQRQLTPPYGWFLIAVGVPLIFFHALNDRDETIRRSYGILLGYGLVAAAGILVLLDWFKGAPDPEAPDARRVSLFLTYGTFALLLALGFLAVFVRNEDDEVWRSRTSQLILLLGIGFSLVGVGSAAFRPQGFVGTGFVVGALGLGYLAAAMGLSGSLSQRGYMIGRLLIGLGALALIAVAVRAALPYLTKTQRDPFLVPGILLGVWGVAALALGASATSDRHWIVMTRRELTGYFVSPVAYLVLVGFAFVGFLNYWLLFLDALTVAETVSEPIFQYYINLVAAMSAMFAVPAITMRAFSEEKRTGTYEVMMSAPVGETSVVVSKFLAAWIFYMICWLPWGLYLLGLRVEVGTPFDARPLIAFVVALGVTGAAFVAMGVFFSSLTRHQIVAAALTGAGMFFFLLMVVVGNLSLLPPQLGQILGKLNFFGLWRGAAAGTLPLRDLFLWGSMAVFWLYATVRVVEARRWA